MSEDVVISKEFLITVSEYLQALGTMDPTAPMDPRVPQTSNDFSRTILSKIGEGMKIEHEFTVMMPTAEDPNYSQSFATLEERAAFVRGLEFMASQAGLGLQSMSEEDVANMPLPSDGKKETMH
jgi:hypothetical protein